MAEFPYTTKPTSLVDFLGKIHTIKKPEKVTIKYLEGLGYKSKNDRYIPGILKSLGFLDSVGVPTQRWVEYRPKDKAPYVLAGAIGEAYSPLYDVYSDAHQKDNEALRNYFMANTDVGESTVNLMIRTFKALCELADFDQEIDTQEPDKPSIKVSTTKKPKDSPEEMQVKSIGNQGITLNVNIQLTLPETKDDIVYDKIFESIKKHFLS